MQINHDPDVLSCLANLSNDEVFTLPALAKQMLDLLPPELFGSTDTTFLDPVCKTGVFLHEIAKRLIEGLAEQMPELQQRLDHIYTKQIFGLPITALMARRTLYCSKTANAEMSIVRGFGAGQPEGNLPYEGNCITNSHEIWFSKIDSIRKKQILSNTKLAPSNTISVWLPTELQ